MHWFDKEISNTHFFNFNISIDEYSFNFNINIDNIPLCQNLIPQKKSRVPINYTHNPTPGY